MAKALKYRQLIKILKDHDSRFEIIVGRGKGSHRMIYHPDIDGRARSFPVTCHSENMTIPAGMLSAIIRRFNLPKKIFEKR